MQITIHRGVHTIGGTCIEISSNGQRIIFDVGSALMEKGGEEIDPAKLQNPSVANGLLPDVKGLYKNDTRGIKAVCISHAHMDHYGLLDHIHPDIPVYLSNGTRALIEIGKVFYPKKSKVFFDNFHVFDHWQPFTLGPFTITSYLMDHSGYDASSFLIEADGEKIFYSGDFRGHGRKTKLLDNFVKRPVNGVNCLLLEGTTLGGEHRTEFASENEVEQGMVDVFTRQKDISFVIASGSNVDRLVSLYRATKKTGKTLVLDLYSYYVLYRLRKLTPGLPPHNKDHIRTFYVENHRKSIEVHLGKDLLLKFNDRRIKPAEIAENRKDMVVKVPLSIMRYEIIKKGLKEKHITDAHFIYSMWEGYMDNNPSFKELCVEFGLQFHQIHVSGHAYLEDLQALAQAIQPDKLIPIHTLARETFGRYFDNVVQVDEGRPFSLQEG